MLIDAFIVRSLLVPSLITSLGPVAGWPGKALRHRPPADEPSAAETSAGEASAGVPLVAGADD